jgi:hypothetical protein
MKTQALKSDEDRTVRRKCDLEGVIILGYYTR